jgi:hypothetical protein
MSQPKEARPIEVVDDVMADVLRRKTPAERLAIAHSMWQSAHHMITNLVRAEHVGWPDEQIGREVARRLSHGAV